MSFALQDEPHPTMLVLEETRNGERKQRASTCIMHKYQTLKKRLVVYVQVIMSGFDTFH